VTRGVGPRFTRLLEGNVKNVHRQLTQPHLLPESNAPFMPKESGNVFSDRVTIRVCVESVEQFRQAITEAVAAVHP